MADSLVLTGTRQVTKHKGDEMVRLDYPRGGNTWHLKRWWVQGNGTVYVDCTVFKVTSAGGDSGYLAIKSSPSVNLRIDHDGSFGFDFYQYNEVERAALYNDSWELVEHYVFPSISGGKIMTVTPADAGTIGGGGGGGGGATGVVTGVAIAAGGSGYTDGTGVAVTGGSGSGLTVDIVTTAGEVTTATVASGGQDYVSGETVTISGGGGDATLTITV